MIRIIKKQNIFILLLALLCVGCNANTKKEPNSDDTTDQLYNYIKSNLNYSITDLRVVLEDDGFHVVINVPGTPDMLQKLCEDSVNYINDYANQNNITISVINPIIVTDIDIVFGWSTDGTLYSSDRYPIAQEVAVSDITEILSDNIDIYAYSSPNPDDVAPIDDSEIEWEIISTQDYIRDGKECIGYRVYINTKRASNSQYKEIFNEIISNDNKYLHTVWFYYDKSAADGSGTADVTMEQIDKDIIPIPE